MPPDPRDSSPFLKEYLERLIQELDRRVDQRIVEQEKRIYQRFDLVEIALNKAERAMGIRLSAMNEIREAMKDQAANKAEQADLERVEEVVNELRRNRANLDGRLAIIAILASILVSGLLRLLSR